MKNTKEYIPFVSRKEMVICSILACVNLALFGVVAYLFDGVNPVFFAVGFVVLYLLEIALVGFYRERVRTYIPEPGIDGLLQEKTSVIIKETKLPVSVFNAEGILVWCNSSMLQILDSEDNPLGKDIKELFELDFTTELFGKESVSIKNKLYGLESFELVSAEGEPEMYALTLNDMTALADAEKLYNDSRVCVAYIAIDNIEDVLQYVHEKFRVAVSTVDDKLKEWAGTMNATIKSYENDKYIMFFDSASLDKCIANRFDILDDIRDTRVGDGVSITISMGVSRCNGSIKECELDARDAIDLALQRGGDQVVYTENGDTKFYGGRTKSVYKRSNVRSRTFTNQLTAIMGRSDNVIIMGHRYGDFDSIGASVGVAKIAMLCGLKVNIGIDLRDKNLAPCIKLMETNPDYAQVFVDNADALDLIGPDTLLVLVDHNNPSRAQFSDVSAKVKNVVIIDHHRKIDTVPDNVLAYYIEPSASSTCELVSEMLESAISSQNLTKVEADILLAGILLDTKQFTRNTGTRTFGAAQYLRGAGASPKDVYSMFKTSADDLRKESRFHTDITVYRGNIAISSCDGDTDASYRIVASKAADKMLTLQGIEAAFTLVRIGDQIHISGRSNGNINVQLILEALNGGGHFDVAGAQIEDESIRHVLDTLKASIDAYLENYERNNNK